MVLSGDESIEVYVCRLPDEHVLRGHDIPDGRFSRVCSRQPYLYWNVVCVSPELNGERPFNVQQERRVAFVGDVQVGARGQGGQGVEGCYDVSESTLRVSVGAKDGA